MFPNTNLFILFVCCPTACFNLDGDIFEWSKVWNEWSDRDSLSYHEDMDNFNQGVHLAWLSATNKISGCILVWFWSCSAPAYWRRFHAVLQFPTSFVGIRHHQLQSLLCRLTCSHYTRMRPSPCPSLLGCHLYCIFTREAGMRPQCVPNISHSLTLHQNPQFLSTAFRPLPSFTHLLLNSSLKVSNDWNVAIFNDCMLKSHNSLPFELFEDIAAQE